MGTAAVTRSVAQVMVEGAPEATMPEEEGVILRPTMTETRVRAGPTETADGQTTGAKSPKEAGHKHLVIPTADDAANPATSHRIVGHGTKSA